MSLDYPRVVACGDSGISVEFGDRIDERVNAKVMALDSAVSSLQVPGLIETVPTYRSLLIHYDPFVGSYEDIARKAIDLARQCEPVHSKSRRLCIPVLYGGDAGCDLSELADRAGLSPQDVIASHAAAEYRVYMIGFQPGFAYLGGLNPRLATPRRPQPRPNAPPGTISIGGGQCAVHSLSGPSGWHWIGQTPIRTFRPETESAFLIKPGDRIKFAPISSSEWEELRRADAAGEAVLEMETVCQELS